MQTGGAYYNEFDPYAAQWLRNLIAARLLPAGEVDDRSILDVAPDDLRGFVQCHFFAGIGGWPHALALAGWGDAPAWTGSCPCQPLSSAGQRKGHADERHLWPAFHRLIAERNPPVVFGEQVASKDGREWLAGVRADLEALGYACGAADLCAASVGAPHIRQRLFWVADAGSGGRDQQRRPAGIEEGARERRHQPDDGGDPCRLADADGGLAGNGHVQPGRQHGQQPQDGGSGGLGDAGRQGLQERPEPEGRGAVGLKGPPADAPGPVGFWIRADWLPCTDGKARRVEPGTFPLAHGVLGRVGRLRAYGNAIVPQVAAEFVSAFVEARAAA